MNYKQKFSAGYKILPEYNLLIDVRVGYANKERLMAYKHELVNSEGYNDQLIKIVDTRDMNWECTIEDVVNYIRELSTLTGGISNTYKSAGIYSSMHQLAYTYAIHKSFSDVGQAQEYFYEIAPALKWLELDIEPSVIEDICIELKKNPQFKL